jgi:hypothetical protein
MWFFRVLSVGNSEVTQEALLWLGRPYCCLLTQQNQNFTSICIVCFSGGCLLRTGPCTSVTNLKFGSVFPIWIKKFHNKHLSDTFIALFGHLAFMLWDVLPYIMRLLVFCCDAWPAGLCIAVSLWYCISSCLFWAMQYRNHYRKLQIKSFHQTNIGPDHDSKGDIKRMYVLIILLSLF